MSKPTEKLAELAIHAANRYTYYHTALLERFRERLYTPFPKERVFDIQSDDFRFKLNFQDYPLDWAIVQRIEARREPETVAAIKALVQKGDQVLEIGGAYGYFTTIMALCTGETGRVVSIEGTPNNFKILKGNIERNDLHWVELHNVFLTESGEGTVDFDIDERHCYGAMDRLNNGAANGHGIQKKVSVSAVQLSKLLKDIEFGPNHIFIDLEGFEVVVFEDLVRTGVLQKYRPTILFETHEMFYKPARGLDYIKELLGSCGYYFRGLSGNIMCHPTKSAR